MRRKTEPLTIVAETLGTKLLLKISRIKQVEQKIDTEPELKQSILLAAISANKEPCLFRLPDLPSSRYLTLDSQCLPLAHRVLRKNSSPRRKMGESCSDRGTEDSFRHSVRCVIAPSRRKMSLRRSMFLLHCIPLDTLLIFLGNCFHERHFLAGARELNKVQHIPLIYSVYDFSCCEWSE